MGSVPDYLKRTLGRILPVYVVKDDTQNDQQNKTAAAELETSGLQDKLKEMKEIELPDGSEPISLGSGVITGILGEGGAAVLYEISNEHLGFQRAIKLLRPNHSKESFNRFSREFRISLQLNHPNIVVVHNAGQWNGLPYIEMEKISGFTLAEMVAQFGQLPLGLCTATGIIICKAFEYLSSCTFDLDKKVYRGLLHLDLKPSNILLSDSGTLKIMDFGLATPIQDARSGQFPPKGVGSLQYTAPELLFGTNSPDERSDLFSLGCILYEIISGTKTFSETSNEELLNARRENSFLPIKKCDCALPSDLVRIIEQCLSFDKEFRPIDIETVRKQLEIIHSKITSLTPENTVSLYVNQRRRNEPFELPKPKFFTKGLVTYLSGSIIAICCGILLFLSLWKPQNTGALSGILVQKIAPILPSERMQNWLLAISKSSFISLPEANAFAENPEHADPLLLVSDDSEFYAQSLDTNQIPQLELIREAWKTRNYTGLLELISELPPEITQQKEITLYRLRALGSGGDELEKALIKELEVPDGEYYFHKARYFYGSQKYRTVLENLAKADSIPSQFISKRILGREIQLYRARALTALFRDSASSENLKAALNSWDKLLHSKLYRAGSAQCLEAEREKENLLAEAQWRGIKIK